MAGKVFDSGHSRGAARPRLRTSCASRSCRARSTPATGCRPSARWRSSMGSAGPSSGRPWPSCCTRGWSRRGRASGRSLRRPPRRRRWCSTPTALSQPQDFRQLYELRLGARGRGRGDGGAQLRARRTWWRSTRAFEAMESVAEDHAAYVKLDIGFHRAVAAATQNPFRFAMFISFVDLRLQESLFRGAPEARFPLDHRYLDPRAPRRSTRRSRPAIRLPRPPPCGRICRTRRAAWASERRAGPRARLLADSRHPTKVSRKRSELELDSTAVSSMRPNWSDHHDNRPIPREGTDA
jgi:hypothetical protein